QRSATADPACPSASTRARPSAAGPPTPTTPSRGLRRSRARGAGRPAGRPARRRRDPTSSTPGPSTTVATPTSSRLTIHHEGDQASPAPHGPTTAAGQPTRLEREPPAEPCPPSVQGHDRPSATPSDEIGSPAQTRTWCER